MSDSTRNTAVRRFWGYVADLHVGDDCEVLASRELIHVSRVIDADGGEVFEGAPDFEAFLFWIDLAPGTSWAHPCRYVLVSKEGTIVSGMREWPPVEVVYDKLEKIERPR